MTYLFPLLKLLRQLVSHLHTWWHHSVTHSQTLTYSGQVLTENTATTKAASLCYKVYIHNVPKVCSCISLYWRLSYILCFNSWDFLHLEELLKPFNSNRVKQLNFLWGTNPLFRQQNALIITGKWAQLQYAVGIIHHKVHADYEHSEATMIEENVYNGTVLIITVFFVSIFASYIQPRLKLAPIISVKS